MLGSYEEQLIDGYFCRTWLPVGEARAAVIIVHGFCEHGGRYARLAEEFCHRDGLAVYADDLRGHGRSKGARVVVRRFEDYVDDVERTVQRSQKQHPGRKIFLLGHSIGGAIALWLAIVGQASVPAIARRPAIDGLILSAPSVQLDKKVYPVLRRFAHVLNAVAPWLRLIQTHGFNLSCDPAVVADFHADPWVFHGRIPVRTCVEILRINHEVQCRAASLTLPVLFLHGTGDRITDPAGSRLVYERAASADKSLRWYPGLYHDLFHEPEYTQVTADVRDWLAQRC